MDPDTNKQLVMEAWREFATRDPDRVRAVFTPDAEWLAPARNATALALDGTHHLVGRERIIRFLTSEFGTVFVADVTIDFRGVYADGDTVIVEERMRATLANGGHYDNEYCFIFELDDGRIRRVREYMDTQRGAEWFATPRTPEGVTTIAEPDDRSGEPRHPIRAARCRTRRIREPARSGTPPSAAGRR